MKTKLLFSSLFTFSFLLSPCLSQVPQGFNYQAIARDGSGNPIANATIKVMLSILSDTTGFYVSGSGTYIWEEEQTNVKTNGFGLFTIVLGNPLASKIQGTASSFSAIDWAKTPLYIGTKIANPTTYKILGSAKLWSVPYSMVSSGLSGTLKKLGVTGVATSPDSALFEVKNRNGQTVFAVYNEGVRVYVDDGIAKSSTKGGFAIGGFGTVKSPGQEFFRVTRDSTRIYLNNALGKSTKGGFAIGGFDVVKGVNQNLLTVSDDSIRMYINDNPLKTTKGGFAIGGFSPDKGGIANFLNVATDATGIINPSQNRILWYPLKNAFLAGKILIEKPDSVGVNSFSTGYESKAKGQYSQAMGYQSFARGDYSTAIGKNAVASKVNSFAFGDNAKAQNEDSYSFGAFSEAKGLGSFAFGYVGRDSLGPTGKNTIASGDYSFAFGLGSQATAQGAFALGADNLSSNYFSMAFGLSTQATGNNSTTFGYKTQATQWVDMAIGVETVASGHHSFAGGYGSKATSFQSFAFGKYTLASGGSSIALGTYTNASGISSFAVGDSAIASKTWAVAIGNRTMASGYASMAGGIKCKATLDHAFAFGYNTLASGGGSVAFGDETEATAEDAFTIGYQTRANGWGSAAFGNGTIVNSYAALVLGRFNDTTGMTNSNWYVSTDPAFEIGNGTSNTDRKNAFTVLQNGNTAIGHSAPTQMLDVNGNARFRSVSSGTYNSPLNISSDGTLTTSTSDISMKRDIVPISQALEKILAMNGVYFSWRNDNQNNRRVGFIAQEMEKVLPEVVFTNPTDGLKGINYPEITAVLAQAVKEQQQQIESQQKEINELKTLVNTLVSNQTGQGNK